MIQTYNSSLLYLLLSKPTFHPAYLRGSKDDSYLSRTKWAGVGILIVAFVSGCVLFRLRGHGFYLGLILIWSTPFLLLLW